MMPMAMAPTAGAMCAMPGMQVSMTGKRAPCCRCQISAAPTPIGLALMNLVPPAAVFHLYQPNTRSAFGFVDHFQPLTGFLAQLDHPPNALLATQEI